jgi:uncharacterized membrane protein
VNLTPLINAEPAVQFHVAVAMGAFVTGLLNLSRRKGDPLHRSAGVLFALFMAATAGSALLITGVMEMAGPEWKGWYSPIHLLVIVTFYSLFVSFRALYRGDHKAHGKEMRGLFTGALLLAGALAFLPGRLLWRVFFG